MPVICIRNTRRIATSSDCLHERVNAPAPTFRKRFRKLKANVFLIRESGRRQRPPNGVPAYSVDGTVCMREGLGRCEPIKRWEAPFRRGAGPLNGGWHRLDEELATGREGWGLDLCAGALGEGHESGFQIDLFFRETPNGNSVAHQKR